MRRALAGPTAFEARQGEAARTLLHNQGYDGGWGLTLTSVERPFAETGGDRGLHP